MAIFDTVLATWDLIVKLAQIELDFDSIIAPIVVLPVVVLVVASVHFVPVVSDPPGVVVAVPELLVLPETSPSTAVIQIFKAVNLTLRVP